jgi:hypothetical protein
MRKHPLCIALIVILLAVIGYLALSENRTVTALRGVSKSDIQSSLGKPNAVYAPDQSMPTFGANPVPPTKENREVWVYRNLMKLTFVYFDARGHVQMIFFTET